MQGAACAATLSAQAHLLTLSARIPPAQVGFAGEAAPRHIVHRHTLHGARDGSLTHEERVELVLRDIFTRLLMCTARRRHILVCESLVEPTKSREALVKVRASWTGTGAVCDQRPPTEGATWPGAACRSDVRANTTRAGVGPAAGSRICMPFAIAAACVVRQRVGRGRASCAGGPWRNECAACVLQRSLGALCRRGHVGHARPAALPALALSRGESRDALPAAAAMCAAAGCLRVMLAARVCVWCGRLVTAGPLPRGARVLSRGGRLLALLASDSARVGGGVMRWLAHVLGCLMPQGKHVLWAGGLREDAATRQAVGVVGEAAASSTPPAGERQRAPAATGTALPPGPDDTGGREVWEELLLAVCAPPLDQPHAPSEAHSSTSFPAPAAAGTSASTSASEARDARATREPVGAASEGAEGAGWITVSLPLGGATWQARVSREARRQVLAVLFGRSCVSYVGGAGPGGVDTERSVAGMVLETLLKCPVDVRGAVASKVVPAGGAAMLAGFEELLMHECTQLVRLVPRSCVSPSATPCPLPPHAPRCTRRACCH